MSVAVLRAVKRQHVVEKCVGQLLLANTTVTHTSLAAKFRRFSSHVCLKIKKKTDAAESSVY